MPGWLIASLLGIGGFAVGVLATVAVLRERRQGGDLDQDGLLPAVDPESAAESREEPAERMNGGLHLVGLIGQALRPALLRLRRESVAPVLVEEFEHVAWQARMLTSHPRPMQAQPSSTIALLQEAAEQVEVLRLGKVTASWTLRTRTPVYVDPERTRAAFRELLAAAASAAGESGRLSVRVHTGPDDAFPVRAEVEIVRKRAEPEPLAFLVAKHLLESQGAQVSLDGRVARVDLRCIAPEGPARPTKGGD